MRDNAYAANNFTPLRLLLALLVVLGHFRVFTGDHYPAWPFDYSQMAVECFFVVSGYLVAGSFDGDPDLRRFFIRRIFRIYPLYLAVVIAQTLGLACLAPGGLFAHLGETGEYLAANAVFANFAKHDIGGVIAGLDDPSLNGSLWTLKIEFAFYLLLPFLWRAYRRYGTPLLLALFAASVLYQQAMLQAGYPLLAKQLPGQLHYFLLGMAAYRHRAKLVFDPRIGLAATILLGGAVTFLMSSHLPAVYPLAVAGFVIAAALSTPRIRLTLDISYGVYLLHAPVIQLSLLYHFYRPDWAGVVLTVATTLVIAAFAERWIEAPGIDRGRRLATRTPAGPPGENASLTVVVLNDFCHAQGGASRVAIDEAIGLARSGVRVIFVGAVGPVCDELAEAPLIVECLDQHELLDVGRHPAVILQGLWNAKAAKRIREILASLPRDHTVLHLHGYTKALTTSPVWAARRLGFPVVCTLHDFFAACPNGAFFDYHESRPCTRHALSAGCIAADCDKRRYAHKLFRLVRAVFQRVLGHFPGAVEHYISLSERSASILAPYLPKRAHLYRLPNVVDVRRRAPVRVEDNLEILCIGRLDEEKGVRLLADTASGLGLSVTFVGDGPLRPTIEGRPGMRVTGWLPAQAVQTHLDRARCLIFPSLWYETFGMTVSEAAARGVPAIISDVSAAAERIDDGVNGWVFRSGDSTDLARCLLSLADDRAVASAGAAVYRRFWSDPPTPNAHADGLLRIYRSALA